MKHWQYEVLKSLNWERRVCIHLVIVAAHSVLWRKCIPYPIYQARLGRYSTITWSVSCKLRGMQSRPSPKKFKPDGWEGPGLAQNNLFISRILIFCSMLFEKQTTFFNFPFFFFKWCTAPGKVMGRHRAKEVIHNGCPVVFLRLSNLRLDQNFLLCDYGKYFPLRTLKTVLTKSLSHRLPKWWNKE